jgi:hypothetical protein
VPGGVGGDPRRLVMPPSAQDRPVVGVDQKSSINKLINVCDVRVVPSERRRLVARVSQASFRRAA